MNTISKEQDLIKAFHIEASNFSVKHLSHPLWDKTQSALINHYWSGEEAPNGRHAEARILWSDDALYVRFTCRQEEPLNINENPQTNQKTIKLWEKDVCEIFITSNPQEIEKYLEFEAAPTGEWIDLAIHQMADKRETDWDFHSGMTTSTLIGEDLITISIEIPWQAFGHIPHVGEKWRGNFFRCVGKDPNRGYLAWCPTLTDSPNFHVPEAFGWIEFLKA
jgi:alpha-galactosidase